MVFLFCAYRDWAIDLFYKLKGKYPDFKLLTDPKKLTVKYINRINPEYIFFPDWSWIIPKEIVQNYNCVCFHESDLPKFRGGSPIQNQIIRNIEKTKTTAFLMSEKLDGGDILLKRELSLKGSLNEIFARMIENDYKMIINIINGNFRQKRQHGKGTYFKRRKPEDSELKKMDYSKKYLYNFIRMLSDPYPNAFVRIGKRKIIFKSAEYNGRKLEFRGEIE